MMKDAFDVLMITHAGLCKGYADALKLILDIDEDDFGTLSFENGESLDDFSEAIRATIEERYKDRNLVVLLDLPGGSPANTALPFMSSSRKLIAGVNLPLVLEIMAMKKSSCQLERMNIVSAGAVPSEINHSKTETLATSHHFEWLISHKAIGASAMNMA